MLHRTHILASAALAVAGLLPFSATAFEDDAPYYQLFGTDWSRACQSWAGDCGNVPPGDYILQRFDSRWSKIGTDERITVGATRSATTAYFPVPFTVVESCLGDVIGSCRVSCPSSARAIDLQCDATSTFDFITRRTVYGSMSSEEGTGLCIAGDGQPFPPLTEVNARLVCLPIR